MAKKNNKWLVSMVSKVHMKYINYLLFCDDLLLKFLQKNNFSFCFLFSFQLSFAMDKDLNENKCERIRKVILALEDDYKKACYDYIELMLKEIDVTWGSVSALEIFIDEMLELAKVSDSTKSFKIIMSFMIF